MLYTKKVGLFKKPQLVTLLPHIKYHDVFTKQTKKVYFPNVNKKKVIEEQPVPKAPSFEVKKGIRTNEIGIQMISKSIYEHVFKNTTKKKCDPEVLKHCKEALEKHNMITKETDYVDDIDFKLPPLEGNDLEEHFYRIGKEQAEPYLNIIDNLVKPIPEPPATWIMQEGWTRYAPNEEPVSVPHPLEDGLVFDVEVCVKVGKVPTLATAVSDKAWYGWVSRALVDGSGRPVTRHQYLLESLIPLESGKGDNGCKLNEYMIRPKVVVGHNVSYDRQRVKEQYWLKRTGTRFVDTMSMHVCVAGLTSYQRAALKSIAKHDECDDNYEQWMDYSSTNSLAEVHKLYCGSSVEKHTRDMFIVGDLKDINRHFQTVMVYCCKDVQATHRVLSKLFPLYLERFPHPVTFAGMLELGTAYLPINSNWNRYIDNAEQAYEDLKMESRMRLVRRADQVCRLLHDERYKEDLWMWDQDWEVKDLKFRKTKLKIKKSEDDKNKESETKKLMQKNINIKEEEEIDPLELKFRQLFEDTRARLAASQPLLPGYPNWYRKLCTKPGSSEDWVPGPHLLTTSMRITPKLLNLTWEGYPLHHIRELGWGFLVPFTDNLNVPKKLPLKELLKRCPILSEKGDKVSVEEGMAGAIVKEVEQNLARKEYYSSVKKDKTKGLYKGTGVWTNEIVDGCCYFLKLPHKSGPSYNVGNPLSKDFLNKFSENVLAGDASAEQVMSIARKLSYWRNNRERIMEQMVVWLEDCNLPKELREDGNRYGAILPQVVVSGTLTRRAVEPTWMTASNANAERVGSELRCMIQAPPGYRMVGADVDSQELWIASVMGDARRAGVHGATPLGWMTLGGSKSAGTDMHSVTANGVGISRDHAKVLNYARIYGAGQNFAERLLKQFNPAMSDSEARAKATKMFNLTKGKRVYFLKSEFLMDFVDKPYGRWEAFELAKMCGKKIEDMFAAARWVGGMESDMFNRLEEIAASPSPVTPFLNGRLSRALEPKLVQDDKFLPTRVNWVVQSGAVDFLHLMLVCMRWLLRDNARFCLSFHDEVRYLVKDEFKYQAALAMHVTNLLTRSFCSIKLGLNDLPMSVAFFSSVEVDGVLRKEAKMDGKTPSNPHGLEKGYNVPNGESLDIRAAIEKAAGGYSCWYEVLRRNARVTSGKTQARVPGEGS